MSAGWRGESRLCTRTHRPQRMDERHGSFLLLSEFECFSTAHDGWYAGVKIDNGGVPRGASVGAGLLLAAQTFPTKYSSTFTVSGGRHTAVLYLDSQQELAESDESNNRHARQFVWTPRSLVAGTTLTSTNLRPREGGWDALPPSGTTSMPTELAFFERG